MTGLRWALAARGAVGVVAGGVAFFVALEGRHPNEAGVTPLLGPLVGWAFIGTGLFASWHRPENRVGALMTGVGFAWCASALTAASNPWLHIIGFLATPLPYVLLMHLLLAFPDGRLHSRVQRVLVVSAYLSGIVVHSVATLFYDPTAHADRLGGSNPLFIGDPAVGEALGRGRAAFGALLVAAMTVVLIRRWLSAQGAQRRAFLPVLVTGLLVAALLALWLLSRVAGLTEIQAGLEATRVVMLALVPFAYLAGLLHSRVAGASAVRELVAHLGEPTRRNGLRNALAEALEDPTLTLVYWLPTRGEYVDSGGKPVALPSETSGRAVTPLDSGGERVAAIIHDASLETDPGLVRAVGAAASLTLENERLDAELRAKVEELRASRARIVESGDAARRRIERDLHDGAQQRLVSLALRLTMLRSKLKGGSDARRDLDAARAELEQALEELRELARGIHPSVLSDRGLDAVLEGLARRAPLPVELLATPGERLPDRVESTAYFVVGEALTNVAKHAGATHARVGVRREGGSVLVEVADDGVGGARPENGSGLRGLVDRVMALDGLLEVDSPPGLGTTLRARIPCA